MIHQLLLVKVYQTQKTFQKFPHYFSPLERDCWTVRLKTIKFELFSLAFYPFTGLVSQLDLFTFYLITYIVLFTITTSQAERIKTFK